MMPTSVTWKCYETEVLSSNTKFTPSAVERMFLISDSFIYSLFTYRNFAIDLLKKGLATALRFYIGTHKVSKQLLQKAPRFRFNTVVDLHAINRSLYDACIFQLLQIL